MRTEVSIVDYTAEVTIRQRFENVEKDPIEAVFEFPVEPKVSPISSLLRNVPFNAIYLQFSVCRFRAEIDGKVIEGQIKEKEKAKNQYDDAVASGHGM